MRYIRSVGRMSVYLRRLRRRAGDSSRWPAPRIPAPRGVSRDREHALMQDQRGPVGIRPEDRTDGLWLIGAAKTGKTSVLCRTVRADALDRDCAVIVLMPKPGEALEALSMVPKDRVVRYLDLERPEFGINPLRFEGDAMLIADMLLDALRDVGLNGALRGAPERYLHQAARAAIGAARAGAVAGQPTLWHMYRLLIPAESELRDRVVEALYAQPGFADTASFFGRELSGALRDAPSNTVAKLDAPRNILLQVLVEALDKVLRHPVQLSLEELLRRREVLIVDGRFDTFGSGSCGMMMRLIINGLHLAQQRQAELPARERARVALKIDEAHLIVNERFADALAALRSTRVDVVVAWRCGEPIPAAGTLRQLPQRCMFATGAHNAAHEISTIGTDRRSDGGMRASLGADTLRNLPSTYAVCSWITGGVPAPAFVARTIPLEIDDEVVAHHRAAQRRRGGYVPDRLPDPLTGPD